MEEQIIGRDGTPLGEMDASIVRANATKALIFGIIGFVFAESGILGLIFSINARNCAKTVLLRANNGKAKAGNILGTIGMVFSIIALVGIAIAIIVAIVGAATAVSYGI